MEGTLPIATPSVAMTSVSWQLDSVPRVNWDVHVQDMDVAAKPDQPAVDRGQRALSILLLFAVIAALW